MCGCCVVRLPLATSNRIEGEVQVSPPVPRFIFTCTQAISTTLSFPMCWFFCTFGMQVGTMMLPESNEMVSFRRRSSHPGEGLMPRWRKFTSVPVPYRGNYSPAVNFEAKEAKLDQRVANQGSLEVPIRVFTRCRLQIRNSLSVFDPPPLGLAGEMSASARDLHASPSRDNQKRS
jgi:hypothetical protein